MLLGGFITRKAKIIPVKDGLGVSKYIKAILSDLYLHQGSFVVICVRLLVCDQDYTKTAEWITTKFGWQINLGPE